VPHRLAGVFDLTAADIEAMRAMPDPYAEATFAIRRQFNEAVELALEALARGFELGELRDEQCKPGELLRQTIVLADGRPYASVFMAMRDEEIVFTGECHIDRFNSAVTE